MDVVPREGGRWRRRRRRRLVPVVVVIVLRRRRRGGGGWRWRGVLVDDADVERRSGCGHLGTVDGEGEGNIGDPTLTLDEVIRIPCERDVGGGRLLPSRHCLHEADEGHRIRVGRHPLWWLLLLLPVVVALRQRR